MNYFELVFYKAYADLKVDASRGYLGTICWMLEPVLYLAAVFYAVFPVISHREEGDFIAFMLTGLVAWKWFASAVAQGDSSNANGAGTKSWPGRDDRRAIVAQDR